MLELPTVQELPAKLSEDEIRDLSAEVRSLAAEYASTGVTINAVCPGYTDTDLVGESVDRIVRKTGRTREAALASLLAADEQDRLIAPAEVAAAVLSLCLPSDRPVTGEAVPVVASQ